MATRTRPRTRRRAPRRAHWRGFRQRVNITRHLRANASRSGVSLTEHFGRFSWNSRRREWTIRIPVLSFFRGPYIVPTGRWPWQIGNRYA